MNPKYEVISYSSDDDQAFVAEVPDLPGCMAHDDSRKSALSNVGEAIMPRIYSIIEIGRAAPPPEG